MYFLIQIKLPNELIWGANKNISFLCYRPGIAPKVKEGSITVGRSFKEWTAMSALSAFLYFKF